MENKIGNTVDAFKIGEVINMSFANQGGSWYRGKIIQLLPDTNEVKIRSLTPSYSYLTQSEYFPEYIGHVTLCKKV